MEQKDTYRFTSIDAENYDEYLGPVLFEPYGEYIATQVKGTTALKVLELACGSGRVTRHLRKALPDDAELWATDLSNDMLSIAKRKMGNAAVHFAVEDIQNLSFADGTFDLVVCQFGLMFLPDKQQGINEIYRVLKPGGQLLLFTWDSVDKNPLFDLLVNKLIVPLFADEEDTSRFYKPYSLYDTAQLAGWMHNAGFKTAESTYVTLRTGNVSAEHMTTGFFRKHPLGHEVKMKAPLAFEPTAHKLKEELTNKYGNGDISLPMSALLTVGVK